MSTQESLIALQKETFLELKNEILEQRRKEDRRLTAYRRTYIDELSNYSKISSKNDLLNDLDDAKIIYCGDFHTLKRSQYTALKILRHLIEQKKRIFLGLELVPHRFEKLANDFVKGQMDEKKFLETIGYNEIWGFPWSNYKPFFDLAIQYQFPILGLNSQDGGFQPLHDRDEIAARIVVDCLYKHPESAIFCLYGDLHVAQKHIPFEVQKLLKKRKMKEPKSVTIFQNSDEIYWKLLDQNLAHQVDVVKLSSDSYCVLSSTPWIKWQSYQSWIEESCALLDESDEEDFGYHQHFPDFFHEILSFGQNISAFLKKEISNLENFEVYTAFDTKVMDKIEQYVKSLENAPKKSIQKILEIEMVENRSILIPDQSVIYLLDFSQNKAIEKASQLVASKLTQQLCIYGKEFDEREIFYRLVLWEAIGYFGSKIINPKRKCDQYKDFETFLERIQGKRVSGQKKDAKIIAQEILKHREYEVAKIEGKKKRQPPRRMFREKPKLFFLCARSLGRILGDQLYSKVISDEVAIYVIHRLYTCLSVTESARKGYWALTRQIKSNEPHTGLSKDELF